MERQNCGERVKEAVIELRNVSKSFEYWADRPNSIKSMLAGSFGRGSSKATYIEVLKNVSFQINAGDFVGIMGRNGAGKSTIMKLISGIYEPTSGDVLIKGPIAPLLELGAGFAEDLSGYDNIFLNAAILGYGAERTKMLLHSIIEFSELGERIHMPIRNYSSGMVVRLAFSIAVHLDAPILLFDEILAVGDAAFEKKCLDKVDAMFRAGHSIVLVTHDPEQVKRFCNRCIVIDNKSVAYDGPVEGGIQVYLDRCLTPRA